MSVNQTTSFGMQYNASNDDLKGVFDDYFQKYDGDLQAVVPSWGCTGSCICCSYDCNSCF